MNNIVLASASIGRKKLFQNYFTQFITSVSNIDESRVKTGDPYELTKKLAFLKAKSISRFYQDDFVIGLDTVVFCEGKIVGKPINKEEAIGILKFLSGKKQSVVTGFCILNQQLGVSINEYYETILLFRELSDLFISDYVKNNPVTKFAGAYAAQDQDEFITLIEGDVENVIGAPMKRIISCLKNYPIPHSIFKKNAFLPN